MSNTKRYYEIILITLIGCFCSVMAFGQLEQPNRFELERKYSDADFTIIPLKEDGLALIRETNKFKSGDRTWEILILDTLLSEQKKLEFDIHNQNQLIGYEYFPGEVSFLFNRNESKGYFDLLNIDLKNKTIERIEIKPELLLQLTHFHKVSNNYIFGGNVNDEPAVLFYNSSRNNLKVLPGFFKKQTQLLDVRINQNQTFNTLLLDRSNRDNQKIIFRTYDSYGKLLLDDETIIESDIKIHSGICSSLEKEDLLIVGTWGKLNSKQSSGIYTISIDPFSDQTMNKFYLGQLNHYLDYLKPKKTATIKRKTNNAIENGEIPEFVNYLMITRLIEKEKEYVMLAESFTTSSTFDHHRSSDYYPYSSFPYGNLYPYNNIYDPRSIPNNDNTLAPVEVRKIQCVAVSFDDKGSILWDYSNKFDDIKLLSLEQIAESQLEKDSLHFLYKKDSEIRIKSIYLDDGEAIENKKKIKLNDSYDVIRMERSQEGSIKHWFDQNFYVWGYQSIRNAGNGSLANREVFYINRLVIE